MELFSLLAKLTLDAKEFNSELAAAQKEADNFNVPDAELDLDSSGFDSGISEAQDTEVDLDDAELGLDTKEFDDGIKSAEENADGFSSVLTQVFENLKGALVTTGVVGAVTGVVSALKEGVELAKNHGDQIDKQSQKMGISAKAYQEWSYALNLSGASIDDLNRGLRTWQNAVGDEEQTDKLSEAFSALGINAKEAFKQIENGENLDSLLNQTIGALADYDQGDRGALASILFGKGANGLNALFNATSEDINEMKQEANDLGLIMTDEEVKNAAAYMDATTRLQGALDAIKESFAASIIPLLTEASNTLASIIGSLNWRTGQTSLADELDKIDQKGAASVKTLERNKEQAEALIEKLSGMGDYWTLDDNGKKTWDTLAAELIELYPQLDTVINNNKNAIKENTQEISANIDEWTKLEQQRVIDQTLADKRQAIAAQYAAALDKEIEAEIKDTEAKSRRSEAIEEINNALEDNAVLSSVLRANFGTDTVTDANADEIMSWIKTNGYDLKELGAGTVEEWYKLSAEAENLRTETAKMTEEADAASESYTQYAETLAQKMGITLSDTAALTEQVNELGKSLDNLPGDVKIQYDFGKMNGFAIGSAYVPYDQVAVVHRGERIQTATDVRRENSSVDYTGLEDSIIAAIQKGMENATVKSYLNGKDITDEVSKQMAGQLAVRRYT